MSMEGWSWGDLNASEHVQSAYGMASSELEKCTINVSDLGAFQDKNFLIICGHTITKSDLDHSQSPRMESEEERQPVRKFVLKVFHPDPCSSERRLRALGQLLDGASQRGVVCSRAVKSVDGSCVTKIPVTRRRGVDGGMPLASPSSEHCNAMLLEYVDGISIDTCSNPRCVHLMEDVGNWCGALQAYFQTLSQDIVDGIQSAGLVDWNPTDVLTIRQYLEHLDLSTERQRICSDVLQEYEMMAVPLIEKNEIRRGVIHGDLSDSNILTCNDDDDGSCPQNRVCGLIDFTDCNFSYIVFELAICAGFFVVDTADPVSVSTAIVHGFLDVVPLLPKEKSIVYTLMCAHMAQVAVLSARQLLSDPGNLHVGDIIDPTFAALATVRGVGKQVFESAWWSDEKSQV